MADYEPWRKNYELIAAFVWFLGAFNSISYVKTGGQIATWAMIQCFVLVLLGLWRSVSAYKRHRRKQRLRGFPKAFLSIADLDRKTSRTPNALWLGYGFPWTRHEAQSVYDLMKLDVESMQPKRGECMGANWIHGMSPFEKELIQPITHTEGHLLIVGTTGSGKTRTFDLLITQAVLRNEAVIIIDPKGDKDLKETAQRACEWVGHPERFVYFHPGFPDHSVRLDPLRNFNRSSEIASRIAQIMPSEHMNDPFKAFGQKSIDNIVQGLLSIHERPTLSKLRRYLEGGPASLVVKSLEQHFNQTLGHGWVLRMAPNKRKDQESRAKAMLRFYRERVQEQHPNRDIEGLLSMFEHDRTHFSKMVASLLPIMNMLTSGSLGALLSPDIDTEDDDRRVTDSARIIQLGQVAYIGLDSLSDSLVGSAIGSILLSDLASVAGDRYNYGTLNRPVNLFVDEAAEVINDPCIQLLNKGRGAGIRMTIATQTFADFVARTGSEAKARQILGNVNNLIALRVLDTETQKYITEQLPLTQVQYIMRTQGTTTQGANPVFYTSNLGERLLQEETTLFPTALLGQLPDLEFIAKLSGGAFYKGRIPILKPT